MSSHVAASLYSFSGAASNRTAEKGCDSGFASGISWIEGEVNRYFSHMIAFYFGQNAFGLRLQAYDDMLWVVLGWMDHIRFINRHMHTLSAHSAEDQREWFGNDFIKAFAHRAHIFYVLASKGWDTDLCNGGMIWNPSLIPYKNAITNELYIAASVSMYLDFPGDDNVCPFNSASGCFMDLEPAKAHDPIYLNEATNAYEWLTRSNMTNDQGLFVDGYHITGWNRNGSNGTKECDERNEMIYTYNQGVLLSGLRGLWESTGQLKYLVDGHALIRNVISATGWQNNEAAKSSWSGLGRNGILEEFCDPSGTCSQDAQTFKGIYFHHMTQFCELLPRKPRVEGKTYGASPAEFALHLNSCKEYNQWVVENAKAALSTRDSHNRFGSWWGVSHCSDDCDEDPKQAVPNGASEYRNSHAMPNSSESRDTISANHTKVQEPRLTNSDKNDRGRGRTTETQGSGLAVVRAMYEFSCLLEIKSISYHRRLF